MDFGLEGLNFNPNSKLSAGLIDLFRDLKSFPLTQPETQDFKKLFYETVTYFENHTEPKLKKLILEQTGIVVEKIYCRDLYSSNNPNTTGCFAMIIRNSGDGKDVNWMSDAQDVIAGGSHKKAHISVETAEQFNNLLSNFDAQVGRFKPAKNVNKAVKCDLVFDLAMVVFVDKITHEKLMPLTSEETTAVMLHELGHIVGTVSYLKYTNYSIDILKGAFDHFTTYASTEEKYTFLNNNLLKKNGFIKKNETTKKLSDTFNELVNELPTVPTLETSYGKTIVYVLNQMLDMLMRILLLIWYLPGMLFFQMISFRLSEMALYDGHDGIPKTTDFKAINRQRYEMERIADEYVTSHNMGSYLQSGLDKLSNLITYNLGKDTALVGGAQMAGYVNTGRVSFHFNNFIGGAKYIFNETVFGAFSAYPPYQERIALIARAQIKNVRSSQKNPILLKLALDEYESTYLNSKNQAALQTIQKGVDGLVVILQNLLTIFSFGMLNANQRRHVEDMLKDAEAIMNNDIYASSAKMRLMYMQKAS